MLIKNKGWLTEHISVTRSVKQGCPVSALLFIVAIEMLSIRLKQNNLIQGLKVRSLLDCDSNIEFKTLQYADDIILLKKDEESLKFALQDMLNSIICDIRHEARICSIIILTLFYNNTAAYSG